MVCSSTFHFPEGKKMTPTMQMAASQAAIHVSVTDDIRQRETHFNFGPEQTPQSRKSRHPKKFRRWYNKSTQRRGRRGSSFNCRR